MSPRPRPSRRASVGRVGARFVQLYEALDEHTCSQCGRGIEPGEFFTRGGVVGQGPSIPVCRDCRPAIPRSSADTASGSASGNP